jgi:hypothetical protein
MAGIDELSHANVPWHREHLHGWLGEDESPELVSALRDRIVSSGFDLGARRYLVLDGYQYWIEGRILHRLLLPGP